MTQHFFGLGQKRLVFSNLLRLWLVHRLPKWLADVKIDGPWSVVAYSKILDPLTQRPHADSYSIYSNVPRH